jgi:CheY-like chemotaxis protein
MNTVYYILIADDEPYQRLLIRETLAVDPSFRFVEAADGLQALQLARQEHPDIILLDVMMPNLDGLEVCRLLKADPTLQAIPVIMISAIRDQLAGQEAGCDEFVPKPFEARELQETVYRLLRLNGPAS